MKQLMTATIGWTVSLMAFAALTGCAGPEQAAAPPHGDVTYAGPTTSAPADPEQVELTEAGGLADCLTLAAMNNPRMQAAFHAWHAASLQSAQVVALPDPKLTYRYYIREVETRVGPQRQAVQLAQTFPWLGKLRLRSEAADQAAEAAQQRYEAVKLGVFYEVKDAYYEYGYLHQAIDLTRQNVDLMTGIERVAAARYRADAGRHSDLIRAQVELGKLEDRLGTLEQLRRPILARLNATMNRPTDAPVPTPGPIAAAATTVTETECRRWLAESNPQLKALDSEIERRQTQIDLARKSYFPDVTVGVQWIDTNDAIGSMDASESGKDAVTAMVTVNLPIWRDKLDASVGQARRLRAAAASERTRKANELETRLAMILFRLGDAERKVQLYRDTLIPKASQSVSATQSAYRAGNATFIDLLDAARIILEFELVQSRSVANRPQRLAELEMIVGRRIGEAESAVSEANATQHQTVNTSGG